MVDLQKQFVSFSLVYSFLVLVIVRPQAMTINQVKLENENLNGIAHSIHNHVVYVRNRGQMTNGIAIINDYISPY